MEKKEIAHPKFGVGKIVQSRNSGFELLVEFNSGSRKWVRFDEIAIQQRSQIPPLQSVIPREPILSEQVFSARRMIEAFRLGIVPYDQVDQFTFGRNAEVDSINAWLKSPSTNIAVIAGEYGTGKSHLLTYTAGKAITSGYAVAVVETDRLAVPFYKPKSVYRHIIKTFNYFDPLERKRKNFRDFLSSAIQGNEFEDHPYFKWFKTNANEALWEWISCEMDTSRPYLYEYNNWTLQPSDRRFNQLPSHTNTANVYCYLLSSLGWAAKNVLGLSGLLVIFDEAESVDALGSQFYWSRANNFIKALIRTANNDKVLLGSNWDTGLDFSAIEKYIPFLYKPRSDLKIMFALTPSGGMPSIIRQYPYKWIDLEKLTSDALSQVFHEIYNRYKASYSGFTIDHQLFEKINSLDNGSTNNVRHFVKASVEALDIIRLTGNKHFLE